MLAFAKFARNTRSHPEQGYILLTLMFIATLVVLSLAALAPKMAQQIQRDREEEMIHRGVQYSRAIQHFYKRTGRYPVRLEELDNFNNVRFLRKHYKDPITGQDFKILHFGDVRTNFGAGIPGAVAAGGQPGGLGSPTPQNAFNNQSFGNQALNNQGFGAQGGFNQPGNLNQPGATSSQANPNNSSNSNGTQPESGSDNTDSASGSSSDPNQTGIGSGPVFGGGPIVGVASTSNKKSIREFNKKNHYKDWQFIYDPSSDRGGLLNTPAQPNLNAGGNLGQNGAQGQGSGVQNQQPNTGAPGAPTPNQLPDQTQQPEQQP